VHTGGEAVVVGDPGEQGAQLGPLGGVEGGAHRVVVSARSLPDSTQQQVSGIGEVQRVQAPVVRVAPPLEDSTLFEGVDERDEPARWRAQQSGQGLLGLAGARRDGAEQPGLGRHEIQLRDSLGETGALVVAVLAMLTTFALISDVLYPLLPVGRFGGVLVLIAAAALLPRSAQRQP